MFVHPDDRAYLKFSIDGRTFEPVTMPFGLLVSPRAWTRVMRPVLEHLRASGFTHIGDVDDHGAVPPGARLTSKADFTKGIGFATVLYERLGLSLHPRKGERIGTQQLTLLGFTVDTAGSQVRLPDSRLARLRWTGIYARQVAAPPFRPPPRWSPATSESCTSGEPSHRAR